LSKTLKEFLAKGSKRPKAVAFAFGRMNPPTAGHEKLIMKVQSIAKRIKGDAVIYVSASQDKNKNPLDARTKIKYLQPLYRDVKFIAAGGNTRTFMEVLKNAFNKKYSDVYMIGGSDRVSEFKKLMTTYNGKDYDFDKTEVMSAGERDPDAQGTSGISGTKMRLFAVKNDYNSFRKGLPTKMKDADGKNLFRDLRRAMGLKEEKGFGVQMKPIMSLDDFEKQELRQEYIEENVFNIGDYVENMNDCTIGKIIKRGTNYLVYEMEDGGVKKAWLHECVAVDSTQTEMMESTNVKKEKVKDVVLQKNSDDLDEDDDDFLDDIEEAKKEKEKDRTVVGQDPDIKDRKGTQPDVYYKGLAKSTKVKRDRYFKKKGAKADDDPSAYEPAPGDAKAKTKPSKHTQKYKQMFGEKGKGLWYNIHKKRKEGRPMRKPGSKGAPKPGDFARARGEAHELGRAVDHTMEITPGEKKGKFKMAPHLTKFDPVEYSIKLKDIKEWSESDKTINKYKDRYGDQYQTMLESVVAKMIEKVEQLDEKIEGLVKKAEKSGIPYSILKQVYNRGMAAYKTGHRPGTTQQQWAFARVNSFITKGSGTWGKADKDLADKVRGMKKETVERRLKPFNEVV
jgi:nicotinic acid mononucleotide adenylyltransferase